MPHCHFCQELITYSFNVSYPLDEDNIFHNIKLCVECARLYAYYEVPNCFIGYGDLSFAFFSHLNTDEIRRYRFAYWHCMFGACDEIVEAAATEVCEEIEELARQRRGIDVDGYESETTSNENPYETQSEDEYLIDTSMTFSSY